MYRKRPTTTYDGKKHTLKNIIGSFSPDKKNRVALFNHWDSRHIADHDTENQNTPILGANDGGSGVGVLIELALDNSVLKNLKLELILFYLMKIMDSPKTLNMHICQILGV